MSQSRFSATAALRGGQSLRNGLKQNGRRRRDGLAGLMATGSGKLRNDILPKLELVQRDPAALKIPARNVRNADAVHVRGIAHSISTVGFIIPALIDENDEILDGVAATEAAKLLGLPTIPCIRAVHLTPKEKTIVRLAVNRLGENGQWDFPELKAELITLVDDGIEIEDTAFTAAEFDMITLDDDVAPVEKGALAPSPGAKPIAQLGDVFLIGNGHRVICGDATKPDVLRKLCGTQPARLVLTDEPYNVPIAGHVTKRNHAEFIMASGEMSDAEFAAFNGSWIVAAMAHLCDGGILGTYIDWRGYPTVHAAAISHGLAPINLCVWTKTNGGMGSLYRSQHELLPLFKKGNAAHVNNIQLGKNGRWRSNVWSYPGASSVSSDSRKGLEVHPTVKPTAMLADAILDLTDRGDIVLDPFLGSGSTLIAADGVGRLCFGVERDPRYIDVIVKRCQVARGLPAVLEATGETFNAVVGRRRHEAEVPGTSRN